MQQASVPQSYEEWRHCITVICNQPLTGAYIEKRIQALNSATDHMTLKFVQLYGEAQRVRTLEWFERAKSEL